MGWDPLSAWMKYVVCIHLYMPWKFGEWGSTPRGARRPSLSVCLFVCPSRYDARHRKPRRWVYVLNLGGTGIRPPDSFSYRSNFRSSFSFSFRSSSCSTTSGDIFYCSGSRQLNHSSVNVELGMCLGQLSVQFYGGFLLYFCHIVSTRFYVCFCKIRWWCIVPINVLCLLSVFIVHL